MPGAGSKVIAVVSVSRPLEADLLCEDAIIMLRGLSMKRSP